MKYENRWKKIGDLGEGGQGKVFRVRDRATFEASAVVFSQAIKVIMSTSDLSEIIHAREKIQASIEEFVSTWDLTNQKALKVLHSPKDAKNSKDAEERLSREIEVMTSVKHPGLLRIEDFDLGEKWFVSTFYPNGTLLSKAERFTGQVERTLTAIRPIVEGVATLHEKGIVHRDIKPENIFVDADNQLVLGDFGLVYFNDRDRTRLSGTIENVGSYDWMPHWATRRRLEEIQPTFDVFSLGKTIWYMVSLEKSPLPLWYHRDAEYDLQRIFFQDPSMTFLNRILDKCIVQREENCLSNASELCLEIDNALRAISMGADPIDGPFRWCRVCGLGAYKQIADIKRTDRRNIEDFGLVPRGKNNFNIFACSRCGHVQLFHSNDGDYPREWKRSE